MSLFDTIAEKAFRAIGATDLRQYEAGKQGRLVGDRRNMNLSANQDVISSSRQLRANSRQLSRDNDYFIGFLKKLDANVIGTDGLKLQVDAKKSTGEKKSAINKQVEEAWKEWSCKKHCDVTGQLSLRDNVSLLLKTLAVDGEFLIRLHFDPTSPYGLKLQLLDVDWLWEDFNATNLGNDTRLANGNRIVMSVELDPTDRPVAYWFTDPRWSTVSVPGIKIVPANVQRLRIPADQIIHRYIKDRIGMTRGIPWAHGAMLTLNQLDGFDEAELIGARINASNMAFVSPPAPTDPGDGGKQMEDTEVAPGQVLELPAGYTVHEFSPNKPQDSSFSTRMLRKVASSLGISYSTLTSDLTQVNFSSIRAGTIEEREVWKMLHTWLAGNLYQDIYEKWLMFNVNNLVPVSAIDQVMYPIWRGRGFEWVDPLKDVNADIAAVNRGFKTITDVLGERGDDFEETMDQHAYERDYIAKLDLQFASPDLQAQLAADAADTAANASDNTDSGATDKKKAKSTGS